VRLEEEVCAGWELRRAELRTGCWLLEEVLRPVECEEDFREEDFERVMGMGIGVKTSVCCTESL
jgi:hypothetical protein